MLDRSEYKVGVPAEELEKYCPGGYHPVRLQDRLRDRRYEIVNKLGFGAYSTVWLARDHECKRDVAIKIVVDSASQDASCELKILRHITDSAPTAHAGRQFVSLLIDSFFHHGPNGHHLCLVTELLGPSVSAVAENSKGYRLGGKLADRVCKQILLALDYLHECGVAHGDIHAGNMLFSATDATDYQLVSSPEIGKVTRKDGLPLPSGIPDYLVALAEFDMKKTKLSSVRIVDFGQAFFLSTPPQSIHTPVSFHPPEAVLHRSLTAAVDMWNFGCMTFQPITGRTLFEAFSDDRELLPQFQKIVGNLPKEWLDKALDQGVLAEEIDESIAEDFLSLEEELKSAYFEGHKDATMSVSEKDMKMLAQYLRSILVVDPKRRATTGKLIVHPWVWRSIQ